MHFALFRFLLNDLHMCLIHPVSSLYYMTLQTKVPDKFCLECWDRRKWGNQTNLWVYWGGKLWKQLAWVRPGSQKVCPLPYGGHRSPAAGWEESNQLRCDCIQPFSRRSIAWQSPLHSIWHLTVMAHLWKVTAGGTRVSAGQPWRLDMAYHSANRCHPMSSFKTFTPLSCPVSRQNLF